MPHSSDLTPTTCALNQPLHTSHTQTLSMLASVFTVTLLASLLGRSVAAPTPTPADEDPALAKRQNAPLFGGWDQDQNVTELVQELSDQVNPIDADVLLPADGFVFDFLSKCR